MTHNIIRNADICTATIYANCYQLIEYFIRGMSVTFGTNDLIYATDFADFEILYGF